MRPARYAGLFYERSEHALKRQLEYCFKTKSGPGTLPAKKGDKVKAVIVPHAGYMYSGPCAAWGYKAIAESGMPDLFIILGTNHSGRETCVTLETFETPMGYVRVDQNFARALQEKGHLMANDQMHLQDHSIEVQLPFLQYAFQAKLDKIKILPILVSDDMNLKQLAIDIKELLVDQDKTATIIVSSDFTHYGPAYGFVPFIKDIKERIMDLDKGAIEFVKKLDMPGLKQYIAKTGITICGVHAIQLMADIVKQAKGSLEHYCTSGDVSGHYENSVSYATIIFK